MASLSTRWPVARCVEVGDLFVCAEAKTDGKGYKGLSQVENITYTGDRSGECRSLARPNVAGSQINTHARSLPHTLQ